MILPFFHSSVENWFRNSFSEATEIQLRAWPEVKKGKSVLIAAPTGSGKTLAAFLSAIDDLVRLGCEGKLEDKTYVVYVSPLKALSNDIEKNLQLPLLGINEELKNQNFPDAAIRVAVRTGDTPTAERSAMIRQPPHILVTTPESLYLLLTSVNGRKILSSVSTLIVDEIHALVGNKRGSHLSLSMERLEKLSGKSLIRIGISATQKPIEKIASFLMGNSLKRICEIIDTGHRRKMELSMEIPGSPLTAVMAHEVWGELYERLVELIQSHKTTLIFVNTRRLAERLAHHLTERLGPEAVTAHHGSMSRENRFDAEQRLKSGSLKALVATASLELGIDIGYVDLVCQIGSPRSIAAFLQRVGRSGHSVKGIPKGKIFPLTRDELVECTALLDAVRRGELDQIIMPEKPIDVLSQQIVAEVASEEYEEDRLFELVTQAYPYRDLTRKEFDEVLKMLSEGFTTRRGRRGAYVFHDLVHKKLRSRKGARLTAIVNGGAIPDNFDFDVIREPENIFVGTLNEDFAIESLPGDIFQLGNTSYRIERVENGKVKVSDAKGQPPSLPFWLGEAPGRTEELSQTVSRLREEISTRLGDVNMLLQEVKEGESEEWKKDAVDWLVNEVGITESAADQLVIYLGLAKASLGVIPTRERLVLERFFDEAGDMHLVVHSPYGNRVNRAWGLSLRKRFCKKFNFELQAAATEDAIILSLGSTHSFSLDEVFHYLKSVSVREVLIQALLDSPMFEIRWRWNASCALALLKRRAGQKVPPQLQRMAAEDLVALVFPDQLACFENIQGEREVPDHPLVNQTIHDCLTEAMDIELLQEVLRKIESHQLELHAKDLREPSPLSQEILTARPYAFLDDAPLEERRTRAVLSRSWMDPKEATDLAKLDKAAIDAVRSEAWPTVENVDELHDALTLLGFITEEEGLKGNLGFSWEVYFYELVKSGRATVVHVNESRRLWVSVERIPQIEKVQEGLQMIPLLSIPEKIKDEVISKEKSLIEIFRGRLEGLGPVSEEELVKQSGFGKFDVQQALLALEAEGFIFRGKFDPDTEGQQWCERRLLARIHRYTLQKLRKEIEAVSPADFMRFLLDWQHVSDETKLEGPASLDKILKQLEGFEAAAASWEADILPSRIKDFDFSWLDFSCVSGKTVWGRFRLSEGETKKGNPVKSTPIMLVTRGNSSIWKNCLSKDINPELSANAEKVFRTLLEKGALFFDDILNESGLLPSQTEEALAELVSTGMLTSDSYSGLRALLVPEKYKLPSSRRTLTFSIRDAGRWTLLSNKQESCGEMEIIELTARTLLNRYGVVFRKIAETENISPPWRELAKFYRTLEARGEIRGGRFVDGVWGEQFALPEAVASLREVRKREKKGEMISLSASDPLNLLGILVPGKKLSSFYGNRILFRDGVPVAIQEGGEVKFLEQFEGTEKWNVQEKLIRRMVSPKLRSYLGKGIG